MDEKKEIKSEPKTIAEVFQKIQIALDEYDDIFSDFDPSNYENRLMSDDFIRELRRRYAENHKGEYVITFSLPKAHRLEKTESLVKRRIKEYFKNRLRDLEKNQNEKMKNGAIRIAIGIGILSIFILTMIDTAPLIEIFSIFSWYLIWSGLENLLESSAKIQKKKVFIEKFTKADYHFIDQEEAIVLVNKIRGKQQKLEHNNDQQKDEQKEKKEVLASK